MHVLEHFQQHKVRGRGFVSWSSMTRTFLRDNNTVFRDLAIVPVTYCVAWHMTQCFQPTVLSTVAVMIQCCVCLSVVVCTECIVANWCVLEQVTIDSL